MYHSVVKRLRALPPLAALLAALLAAPTTAAGAQTATDSASAPRTVPTLAELPEDPRALAQTAQSDFERSRRLNLPRYRCKVPRGRACPEPVGPVSPARGPPTDWGELVQIHDDREVFQASPDELPAIDIHNWL